MSAHSHHPGQQQPTPQPLPGVNAIIAVGSGKGGVGKTTLSVNLAVALSKMGLKVGLLDGDVYGPNVPLMLGTNEQPKVMGENQIAPIHSHGLKVISVGFLNPGDKPLIWRGPMLHSIIKQFLGSVQWGQLDYLVIDLPPGTGDVALSLIQTVPLTGAIVLVAPLAASALGAPYGSMPGILAAVLLGTVALSLIGAVGAGLTLSLRRNGPLLALLVLPLAVPVLIFGARATALPKVATPKSTVAFPATPKVTSREPLGFRRATATSSEVCV